MKIASDRVSAHVQTFKEMLVKTDNDRSSHLVIQKQSLWPVGFKEIQVDI
jgi:hypothetical protein